MTDYSYQVYSFYIKEGEGKGINKYQDFEDYQSAMDCYKEYRTDMQKLIKECEVKDWFLILSRVYIKGNMRINTNIKYEGTI